MSTSFLSLPVVSLAALSSSSPKQEDLAALSSRLDEVFSTTGFAYLNDLPLTYTHEDVFELCNDFFGPGGPSIEEKMDIAKKAFVKGNKNTYRGCAYLHPTKGPADNFRRYFPAQAGSDNLKEGFELGPPLNRPSSSNPFSAKLNLTESNVFPKSYPSFQGRCETLHTELQSLSARLLSLLAVALGKTPSYFDHYLTNSLSTLRLLHYPPVPASRQQELICTPHTDSGILTLLHQDNTGGLEVRNSNGEWIPAPYVPGSVVVNIGDLMAKVSGNRWVATFHRVRSAKRKGGEASTGRYSVPFFFEPGLTCVVKGVEGDEVVYGEHLLEKMRGWVEFQNVVDDVLEKATGERQVVEAF
jgi:isopenicillin N synthase-like dioxygenase